MSRFEGELKPSADAALSITELLTMLGDRQGGTEPQRQQAIACFLSASDGWNEAVKSLGGAFANGAAAARLKDGKAG